MDPLLCNHQRSGNSVITGYAGIKPKPSWARWQAVDRLGNVMVFGGDEPPVFDDRTGQWFPDARVPYQWVNLCIPVPENSLIEI